MIRMNRRLFLKSAALVGCSAAAHPLMTTMTFASAPSENRLVVIILRGAMDGLDAIQPYGDPMLGKLRKDLSGGPAAGAVDHDRVLRQVEAIFGHLAPRARTAREPARWQGAETRRVKKLEQAHFALAFEGPGYQDPDFYAAQIWTSALGGGMSSRLFQKVREERGLCYSIFAQSGFHDDTGMVTVYAGTSGDQVGDLANITIDEIRRSAEDMTEAEIARARAQLKAGLLMGLESPTGQAERMARSLAIWGRIPDPAEVAQRIDAVTVADVRDHAGRLIANARPALALYGPVRRAPGREELARRLAA